MFVIKTVAYPFVFILSWWHWGIGHVSYLIMDKLSGNDGFWFHVFFELYQYHMGISGELQAFVDGKGKLWPWEDTVVG